MSQIESAEFNIADYDVSDLDQKLNLLEVDSKSNAQEIKWKPNVTKDVKVDDSKESELDKISDFDPFMGDEDDYFGTGGTSGKEMNPLRTQTSSKPEKVGEQKSLNLKSFGFDDDVHFADDNEKYDDILMRLEDVSATIDSMKEDIDHIREKQKVTNDRLKRIMKHFGISTSDDK